MSSKKMKKVIGYTAATAALCAVVDLMSVFAVKAWDYDDFKDDHYKMEALERQRCTHPSNKEQVKENMEIEKKLAKVHADHKALQEPIPSFLWGKFSNKCPICGGQ